MKSNVNRYRTFRYALGVASIAMVLVGLVLDKATALFVDVYVEFSDAS